MRACLTCGASLEGRDKRARHCNDVCRARGKRGVRAETPPEAPETPPTELMSLEDVALELAGALRSSATPAASKAALAKQYVATLTEIEKTKPREKDGFDELLERRARRTGS